MGFLERLWKPRPQKLTPEEIPISMDGFSSRKIDPSENTDIVDDIPKAIVRHANRGQLFEKKRSTSTSLAAEQVVARILKGFVSASSMVSVPGQPRLHSYASADDQIPPARPGELEIDELILSEIFGDIDHGEWAGPNTRILPDGRHELYDFERARYFWYSSPHEDGIRLQLRNQTITTLEVLHEKLTSMRPFLGFEFVKRVCDDSKIPIYELFPAPRGKKYRFPKFYDELQRRIDLMIKVTEKQLHQERATTVSSDE